MPYIPTFTSLSPNSTLTERFIGWVDYARHDLGHLGAKHRVDGPILFLIWLRLANFLKRLRDLTRRVDAGEPAPLPRPPRAAPRPSAAPRKPAPRPRVKYPRGQIGMHAHPPDASWGLSPKSK